MASPWSRFASWKRRRTPPQSGPFGCEAAGTVISSPLIGSFSRPRACVISVPQDAHASFGSTRPRRTPGPFLLLVLFFFMTGPFIPVERHHHAVLPEHDLHVEDLSSGSWAA